MSLKYEPSSEPQDKEVVFKRNYPKKIDFMKVDPKERESYLLTTHWSESTLSS